MDLDPRATKATWIMHVHNWMHAWVGDLILMDMVAIQYCLCWLGYHPINIRVLSELICTVYKCNDGLEHLWQPQEYSSVGRRSTTLHHSGNDGQMQVSNFALFLHACLLPVFSRYISVSRQLWVQVEKQTYLDVPYYMWWEATRSNRNQGAKQGAVVVGRLASTHDTGPLKSVCSQLISECTCMSYCIILWLNDRYMHGCSIAFCIGYWL